MVSTCLCSYFFKSLHMILNKNIVPKKLQGCYEHHLNKWNQLAEDEPVVDHLGGRGGGQALHLADEDRGHHQHGGQVHAQGCLEEEGLEEGGGVGDHHEEEGGEVGGHHLAHNLPLQCDRHTDSSLRTTCMDKHIAGDGEKRHIR